MFISKMNIGILYRFWVILTKAGEVGRDWSQRLTKTGRYSSRLEDGRYSPRLEDTHQGWKILTKTGRSSPRVEDPHQGWKILTKAGRY
jgi:hypothetical protein